MSLSGGTLGIRRAPSIVASELGAQRGFDRAVGRDPASMQRATSIYQALLQQQGQNQRAGMQAGLDQQRINMDRETQGFTNRRQSIVEALRNQVAQEPDPTKRRSIVQYMRDVEGTTAQADPYLVVPGGQQVDPTSGRAYNTPSTVFNRTTGQFMQQPGQQAQSQQFQAGQVYVDGQGRRAKFNGTGWEPPPARNPNQLGRPGAARIARLLRCALWPGLEPQHAPAVSLGHGLNPARVLSAADLEHCLGCDIVLRARELVQQAGGHVGGQGGGGQEEGGEDEEGAHGRNVAGASPIVIWMQVKQSRCYHHEDGPCTELTATPDSQPEINLTEATGNISLAVVEFTSGLMARLTASQS
uniref:Uncharacterized protein n=1 Tax=Solanum lycopersicum TaxID=4081 RepID=A0A494G9S1_SOLLC